MFICECHKKSDKNVGKMTLDEAIEHCIEVFESEACEECAMEHLQLANWLIELKEYKEKYSDK
jgi:hypothetical protein